MKDRLHDKAVMSVVSGLVIALLAMVPTGSSASADSSLPGRAISWLAAGDSYSSGEGLPHSTGGCAKADGADSKAWAQEAHNILAQSGKITTSRFDFVACTGALSGDFFSQRDNKAAQWDGQHRYDLVTFTFGGDDADFASFLIHCIFMVCPSDASTRDTIRTVGNNYRAFLERVANQASSQGGNILVLGYPELIEDPNQWTGIPQFTDLCQGLGRNQAVEIRGLAGALNQAIGNAVSIVNSEHPNGVTLRFLDVNSGGSLGINRSDARLFEPSSGVRHNLCGADSWMNGASSIDRFHGSFHPKQAGLDSEANMVEQVLTTQMDWTAMQPTPTQDNGGQGNGGQGNGGQGNGGQGNGGQGNGGSTNSGPVSFAVTGSCTTSGGTLIGTSGNFTPGGRYTVSATRPDGSSYPLGVGSLELCMETARFPGPGPARETLLVHTTPPLSTVRPGAPRAPSPSTSARQRTRDRCLSL